MTENVTVEKVINQVQVASDGPQGPTGPTGATGAQGPSGVLSVTAPITNSGTSTSAVIGINAGVANGVATLDSDGKIPQSQIPAVAITNTFVVASQAAMLALTAEEGDVAVRTDLNKTYILVTTPASTLGNWQELLTPTDAVSSVDGRTGTVTLNDLYAAKTHASTHASGGSDPVTLAQSQVTNLTSDLAAKAPLASPTFTGTPSLPTGTIGVTQTAGNSTTALATTAFVTTADNLKANIASPTFTGTVTIPAGSSISGVPYLATANTFTGGVQQITTSSAATIGFIVKATASQTADLSQWQNSAGDVLSNITSAGGIETVGSMRFYTSTARSGWSTLTNTSGNLSFNYQFALTDRLTVTAGAAATVPLTVKGSASQSGDMTQWQNSSSSVIARIAADGRFDTAWSMRLGSTSATMSGGPLIFMNNATAPSANPTGGGYLYVESGALKYRGSSGTITTLGAA